MIKCLSLEHEKKRNLHYQWKEMDEIILEDSVEFLSKVMKN